MNVHHLPVLAFRTRSATCISQRRICAFHNLSKRKYATHRDPSPSSLLTSALDQKQRATQREESVGPFQLGLSQASLNRGQKAKKWSELSTTGKVVRTTVRTTNLTVILLGAGLSAVLIYALTSELFSQNSPTVLYGKACERIKASPRVEKYLHDPLIFHNNPPSSVRPRHRNRHVSSQIAVDSSGREHLLLSFYVQGQPPSSSASSSSDEPHSYIESLKNWTQSTAAAASEMTLDESIAWSKERMSGAWDASKRAVKYLIGNPVPPPPLQHPPIPEDNREQYKEEGSVWSIAGLFSGLRGKRSGVSDDRVEWGHGPVYTEGEVHADLVRNDEGYFVFRYLLIDIPNSASRNPIRVFVEQAPGVRENEPIWRWHS